MTCASLAGQVYAKQLYSLQLGLPQWHPEVEVKLGDVGFFLGGIGGRFFRLHNVFEPEESQPDGVPEGFEPLVLPTSHRSTTLCERNAQTLSSISVKKSDIGAGVTSDFIIAGGGFHFSCESGSGGVLVLKNDMHGEHLMCARHVRAYIQKHVESWYTFLDHQGFRDELGQQDLLLVTGRSTTSDWAVAAFTQKRVECSIEFHTGIGAAGASVALGGSWANANAVEHRAGPITYNPFTSPSETPSSTRTTEMDRKSQTMFVRGLYARVRNFRLPAKIKAAAEHEKDPHPGSPDGSAAVPTLGTTDFEDRVDDASSLSSITSSLISDADSDDSDDDFNNLHATIKAPASQVIDYIMNFSDARIAIADDKDVYSIIEDGHNIDTLDEILLQKMLPTVQRSDEITRIPTIAKANARPVPPLPRKEVIFKPQTSSLPGQTSKSIPRSRDLRIGAYLRNTFNLDKSHDLTLDGLQDPQMGRCPPYRLPLLMSLAIYSSPYQRLTLDQMLDALANKFEWFRAVQNNTDWKNTVRHNLSTNKMFKQVSRPFHDPEKFSYWVIDPDLPPDSPVPLASVKKPMLKIQPGSAKETSSFEDEVSALISAFATTRTAAAPTTGRPRASSTLDQSRQLSVARPEVTQSLQRPKPARTISPSSTVYYALQAPKTDTITGTIGKSTSESDEGSIQTFFVRALYTYQTKDYDKLSFKHGDVIEVLTRVDSGWWDGLLNDRRGWFPSNYVEVISLEEADALLDPVDPKFNAQPTKGQPTISAIGPSPDSWLGDSYDSSELLGMLLLPKRSPVF